jgi:putative SOS response-associated peptidase YedK
MCGRFQYTSTPDNLIKKFRKIVHDDYVDFVVDYDFKNLNVRPTEKIVSVLREGKKYNITGTKWGIKFNGKSPLFTSLITCEPNKFMTKLHNRMPVILSIEQGIEYMSNEPEHNYDLCKSYQGEMQETETVLK